MTRRWRSDEVDFMIEGMRQRPRGFSVSAGTAPLVIEALEDKVAALRQEEALGLAGARLPKDVRALHEKAVGAYLSHQFPCMLYPGPYAIATVTPADYFEKLYEFNLDPASALDALNPPSQIRPIVTPEMVFKATEASTIAPTSYSITHRGGHIDAAWRIGNEQGDRKIVAPLMFQNGLFKLGMTAPAKLKALGTDPPFVVMATIAGIVSHQLAMGESRLSRPSMNHQAPLPSVVDDHISADALQPMVDALWMNFGEKRLRQGREAKS
jgi:hypothetical protein